MKKFLSGFLSCAIIMTLALSIMAITGKTTIDVYPIDIMVNGEVFQPTNAQGKPVDVFTYKGTTYAPLRALAVAYGLEVGYDAEKKLATVSEPEATPTPDTTAKPDYSDWSAEDEAAYQEFKAMWDIDVYDPTEEPYGIVKGCFATYNGTLTDAEIKQQFERQGLDTVESFASRLMFELYNGENIFRIWYYSCDNKSMWVTAITKIGNVPKISAKLGESEWFSN